MTSLYPAPELKVNVVLTSLLVLQIFFSFHQQVDFLTIMILSQIKYPSFKNCYKYLFKSAI